MTIGNSNDTAADPAAKPAFHSALKEGHQRFLAHVIEHALACGRRSPEDFIRHFTPRTIMKGLEHEPALRASILVLTTGLKEKIALKKEWEDATTDLQIALEEGETDAQAVVTLFSPDDRVRFLDPQKIWTFINEGDFWKSSSANKTNADVARSHVAFMLERAFEDKLITHRDVVEGVTVEELANRMPKAELGRIIMCALQNADRGTSFTEADLMATTPPKTLVQYVPLAHLWDSVIVPKIAERHGYQNRSGQREERSSPQAAPAVMSGSAPSLSTPSPSMAPFLPDPPKAPPLAEMPRANEPGGFPVKEGGGFAKFSPPKPKDGAKDVSKVKLKQPDGMRADGGPSVAKPASDGGFGSEFGSDSDDIEVIEDDLKTG
jgi:hypothetical protein